MHGLTHRANHRLGIVLPIVCVVLATLTLAVTIFAEQMLAEYRATRTLAGQLQAACAAQSGIEFAQQVVRAQPGHADSEDLHKFQQLDASSESGFWIAAGRDQVAGPTAFGLFNESAKLNLNGLAFDSSNAETSRNRLMQLPRMTPQIADAILDWIDPDDSQRVSGAERNWYSAARAERLPAQGPLRELSELLFVSGVTAELLFGEDTNGNGWLDDCENDGAVTPPLDNADGKLDRGWSRYLTVVGAESNYRDAQRLKVHVNESNLVKLYDQLLPELGPAATNFVVALRLEGPRQQGDVVRQSDDEQKSERMKTLDQRLKDQLDRVSTSGAIRRAEARGGLDLSAQPTYTIQSMADLIGCEVLTIVNGQQELLKSPWDVSQIEAAIAQLEQVCTTKPSPKLIQRINIQQADVIVLRTIPGLDVNKAQSIASRRSAAGVRRSVGWLVHEGLLSLEQLRLLAPFMTTGGEVWSGTSIGQAKNCPSLLAVHFTIDDTLPKTRVLKSQESMPFTLPSAERPQL